MTGVAGKVKMNQHQRNTQPSIMIFGSDDLQLLSGGVCQQQVRGRPAKEFVFQGEVRRMLARVTRYKAANIEN